MNIETKQNLLKVSVGEKKAQLVLKSATIIDVFTHTFFEGDIAVEGEYIAGVGSYEGEREVNLGGKFVAPGFIDAHVHVESSMVSPRVFASKVLPTGTTTLIVDPHEIVNVVGELGIQYFLEEANGAAVNIFLMLPSCVPLNERDNNGAVYGVKEMKFVCDDPLVLGLGEVMDQEAVIAGDRRMLEKISLLSHKIIDGHAPMLSGKKLQAYRVSGVESDHECGTYDEALEKLRAGFFVQIREGSAAKNLEAILKGALKDHISFDRFVFCTDDKHLEDLARMGHINWNIKKAISVGVPPVDAIAMATINTARMYGLRELGAIAPGYKADLVVLSDLQQVTVADVYKDGIGLNNMKFQSSHTAESALLNTVHIKDITKEQLEVKINGLFPVIELQPDQLYTKRCDLDITSQNGAFVPYGDFLKVAVVQRHDGSGRTAAGIVKGFGLKHGAVAGTIAHDAHNLIVIGDNDDDMICAVRELIRVQGGYTLVSGGVVKKTIALPIAGLFADKDSDKLTQALHDFILIGREMGIEDGIDPFLNLSFLSLPVIPQIRITDNGIFDVLSSEFLTQKAPVQMQEGNR